MKALARAGIFFSLLLAGATANAGWSGNIGWQSDYYFRGIFQKSSSAQGGIDFEHNGFYVGTWAADVGGGSTGDGLEIDYYVGYGGEAGDFSYGIGYTGYTYTGDFDDTYQEINLSAGFSFVACCHTSSRAHSPTNRSSSPATGTSGGDASSVR